MSSLSSFVSTATVAIAAAASVLAFGGGGGGIVGAKADDYSFTFTLLPDPTMPSPQTGYLGAQLVGESKSTLVCSDGITPLAATLACRAAGYAMPDFVNPDFRGMPPAGYDANAMIGIWNINCNDPADTFPCNYNVAPEPEDCSSALFLDCSAGTPVDPNAGPFNYYFAFTGAYSTGMADFSDKFMNNLVSFLEQRLYTSISTDRIKRINSEFTPNPENPAIGTYGFNVSFSSDGGYPPTAEIEGAINANPFDIFPRDMKLSWVVAKGTNGPPPAGPTYAINLVPREASRPWSGYITVTPSNTGVAGTICNDGLSETTAPTAICIAAGFENPTPVVDYIGGSYDAIREAMPILWRSLNCDGAAANVEDGAADSYTVSDCDFDIIDEQNPAPQCYHGVDVFIDCYNGGSPPSPPTPYYEWTAKMNLSASIDQSDAYAYTASIVRTVTGMLASRVVPTGFSVITDANDAAVVLNDGLPVVAVSFVVGEPAASSDVGDTTTRGFYDFVLYGWTLHDALRSYLVLGLSSNSTAANGEIPAVGRSIDSTSTVYLSSGNHGHMVVRRAGDSEGETVIGTGCTIDTPRKDDATSLCDFASPIPTGGASGYSAIVGAFPRYSGATAEKYGPLIAQGNGCFASQSFASCFATVAEGDAPMCDYVNEMSAVCAFGIEPMSDSFDPYREVNVVNFNITTGVGFDWDNFINTVATYFAISPNRFAVRDAAPDNSYIIFYIEDVNADYAATDVPRIFYEYFFTKMDWAVIEDVRVASMIAFRGPPYVPPPPAAFQPTDLTGWNFRIDVANADEPDKGLLRAYPPGEDPASASATSGTFCSDAFSIELAQAICRTIKGKDVANANFYEVNNPQYNLLPKMVSAITCPDPTTALDGCGMTLTPSGADPSVCTSETPIYMDCSVLEFGTTNFTFVSQQQPFNADQFASILAVVLGDDVSVDRIEATIAATSSVPSRDGANAPAIDTVYYTVRFNTASLNPNVYTLEQRVRDLTNAAIVDHLGCLELRASDVHPNGEASFADQNNFVVTLTSAYPSLFRSYGRVDVQPGGSDVRVGTVCASSSSFYGGVSESTVASYLCQRAGAPSSSPARLIKNAMSGSDIIYVGGVAATAQFPYFELIQSTFYEKSDRCSHLDDVGILCGRNIRPSGYPLIFRTHYNLEDQTIDRVDSAILSLSAAIGVESAAFVSNGFVSNSGEKYFEFSFTDSTDGLTGDDNALVLLLVDEYRLKVAASVARLEIYRDWIDPSLTTTTTTTTTAAPTTPTDAPTTDGPTITNDPNIPTPAATTTTATTSGTAVPSTSEAPATTADGPTTSAVPPVITTEATTATATAPLPTTTVTTGTTLPPTPTTTAFKKEKTIAFNTTLSGADLTAAVKTLIDTRQDESNGNAFKSTAVQFVKCSSSGAEDVDGRSVSTCTIEFGDAAAADFAKKAANDKSIADVLSAADADSNGPTPSNDDGGGSSNTGVIVAIVVVVVVLAAVAVVGFVIYRRRSTAQRSASSGNYGDDYAPLELKLTGGGDMNIQRVDMAQL